MNDDIWAKLIYFEQNRRLAKAYVSAPVLTIDGSSNGLDGFRIGLNGIENDYRNLDSMACLRSIGQGIKLKIDAQGNILVRRNGSPTSSATSAEHRCKVYIKSWAPIGKPTDPIVDRRHRKLEPPARNLKPTKVIELEDCRRSSESQSQAYKLFDMDKFRLKLEYLRCHEAFDEFDYNSFDWRECVSVISFVGPNASQIELSGDSLLLGSSWIMLINIIAIDMLNNLICNEIGSRRFKRSTILMQNNLYPGDKTNHNQISSYDSGHSNGLRQGRNDLSGADLLGKPNEHAELDENSQMSLDERVRRISKLATSMGSKFGVDKGNEQRRSNLALNSSAGSAAIYTTFDSKFINRSRAQTSGSSSTSDYQQTSHKSPSRGSRAGWLNGIEGLQYGNRDWNNKHSSRSKASQLSQSNLDLSQRRWGPKPIVSSAFRMNYDDELESNEIVKSMGKPKHPKITAKNSGDLSSNQKSTEQNGVGKPKISNASLDSSSAASSSSSGCVESYDYFLTGNSSSSMSSSTTSNNEPKRQQATANDSEHSDQNQKQKQKTPEPDDGSKVESGSSGILGASSSTSSCDDCQASGKRNLDSKYQQTPIRADEKTTTNSKDNIIIDDCINSPKSLKAAKKSGRTNCNAQASSLAYPTRRGYRIKKNIEPAEAEVGAQLHSSSQSISGSMSSLPLPPPSCVDTDRLCCRKLESPYYCTPELLDPTCCCGCVAVAVASSSYDHLCGSLSASLNDCDQCRDAECSLNDNIAKNPLGFCVQQDSDLMACQMAAANSNNNKSRSRLGYKRRPNGQQPMDSKRQNGQERSKSLVCNKRNHNFQNSNQILHLNESDAKRPTNLADARLLCSIKQPDAESKENVLETPTPPTPTPTDSVNNNNNNNCRWSDRRRKYGKIISKFIHPFQHSGQQQAVKNMQQQNGSTRTNGDAIGCDAKTCGRWLTDKPSDSRIDLSKGCMQC